jgi:prophage regulatory protein
MTRTVNYDNDSSIPSADRAAMPAPPRILRLKEVCKMVGLGRSFVYRLQTENRFPHSIKIGVRAVGWLEDEVRTWLADKIANSRRSKPDAG